MTLPKRKVQSMKYDDAEFTGYNHQRPTSITQSRISCVPTTQFHLPRYNIADNAVMYPLEGIGCGVTSEQR